MNWTTKISLTYSFEALMRPGRLEVQMEISLPNESGRVQILNIHTKRMREFKKIDKDVNPNEIATLTKVNIVVIKLNMKILRTYICRISAALKSKVW